MTSCFLVCKQHRLTRGSRGKVYLGGWEQCNADNQICAVGISVRHELEEVQGEFRFNTKGLNIRI